MLIEYIESAIAFKRYPCEHAVNYEKMKFMDTGNGIVCGWSNYGLIIALRYPSVNAKSWENIRHKSEHVFWFKNHIGGYLGDVPVSDIVWMGGQCFMHKEYIESFEDKK